MKFKTLFFPLILLLVSPYLAVGNGLEPSAITACGDIDEDREVPGLTVSHVLSDAQPTDGPARKLFDIVLDIEGRSRLRLASYQIYEGEDHLINGGNWLARNSVCDDIVRAGWLRGAPDLLLLHWTDISGMGGTGLYVDRFYVLVQVTDTEAREILRFKTLRSANSRHANYGRGLGSGYFSFNPRENSCTLQARFSKELDSTSPLPLHRRYKDGYYAYIMEEVVVTWAYTRGELRRESVELTYVAQEDNSLRDIALHYLGPRAPAFALAEANRDLKTRMPEHFEYSVRPLPKGTLVSIPLPADWLAHYYQIPETHNTTLQTTADPPAP